MAEDSSLLFERWRVQHEKVNRIGKFLCEMNAEELAEEFECLHLRREYLERRGEEDERELQFIAYALCLTERRLAGHDEAAARFNQCRCEWCLTGSDEWTGLKT